MANISFPSDGHRLYSQIEERSFWYNHRNDILLNALRNFPPPGDLLDVGGGTGFVALALTKAGFAATVVEPDPEGAEISRARGLEVIEEPFQSESIEPGSVSAIGAFDVIEHIENDAQILNDFAVALAPKGRLYLTVPAFAWLWNQEDVYAGHFRRYSASDLQHRVEAAGLEVAYTTYCLPGWSCHCSCGEQFPARLGFVGAPGNPSKLARSTSCRRTLSAPSYRARSHGSGDRSLPSEGLGWVPASLPLPKRPVTGLAELAPSPHRP